MNVYEITIKPLSGFGTPFKGDTLFGHFCWQISHDEKLISASLKDLLSNYDSKPFAVFSSAFMKFKNNKNGEYVYVLKRPEMPFKWLFDHKAKNKYEIIRERKTIKGKKWMIVHRGQRFSSFRELTLYNDNELFYFFTKDYPFHIKTSDKHIMEQTIWHNTINRITGTTGEARFAPFSEERERYFPGVELVIFVGIESFIKIEQIRTGLERIGVSGFGRDASTGGGKFEVCDIQELKPIGSSTPNAVYTLSPSVPQKSTFIKTFFSPFIRFGKHGDVLARSTNPFKNPIIMVDEGAVLMPIPENKEVFNRPYIGTAVTGISKAEPSTVAQGYALYIPVKLEVL